MTYTKQSSLEEFNAWGGARAWLNEFKEHPDALNYLEQMIDDSSCENARLTETDINDFIWFDAYDVLVDAGLIKEKENGGYVYKDDDDEEEEDDED